MIEGIRNNPVKVGVGVAVTLAAIGVALAIIFSPAARGVIKAYRAYFIGGGIGAVVVGAVALGYLGYRKYADRRVVRQFEKRSREYEGALEQNTFIERGLEMKVETIKSWMMDNVVEPIVEHPWVALAVGMIFVIGMSSGGLGIACGLRNHAALQFVYQTVPHVTQLMAKHVKVVTGVVGGTVITGGLAYLGYRFYQHRNKYQPIPTDV